MHVAPCWTLMVAFPQAMQPNFTTLGPQWNAARSTHHRVAWLARESSKPGRGAVERRERYRWRHGAAVAVGGWIGAQWSIRGPKRADFLPI